VFDHVTIRASDREASERFYDTVLPTVGVERTKSTEAYAVWRGFSLARATDESPVTRRLHVAFAAPSRAQVDEFWRVGTEAGYRDDGAPGPRPQYSADYYGAFLLDPDGNSAEAVHHSTARVGVDHLWIRVGDVARSRRFYETIAAYAGFRLKSARNDFAHFAGNGGSFSVLLGPPTQNVHVAFPASDDATIDAFHTAATQVGYRDHGAPGLRPVYHAGYYGAFVLDPDGNNIEVVNHNLG
jgi:catechol 2,3-dioxygenase-like lactoylglutathione lyase family enzyme